MRGGLQIYNLEVGKNKYKKDLVLQYRPPRE